MRIRCCVIERRQCEWELEYECGCASVIKPMPRCGQQTTSTTMWLIYWANPAHRRGQFFNLRLNSCWVCRHLSPNTQIALCVCISTSASLFLEASCYIKHSYLYVLFLLFYVVRTLVGFLYIPWICGSLCCILFCCIPFVRANNWPDFPPSLTSPSFAALKPFGFGLRHPTVPPPRV